MSSLLKCIEDVDKIQSKTRHELFLECLNDKLEKNLVYYESSLTKEIKNIFEDVQYADYLKSLEQLNKQVLDGIENRAKRL